MGLYAEQVLPRIVDVVCNAKEAHPQRRRVCEKLAGEVIEIGFGSGLNVPYYPTAVTEVTAVEPADLSWKLAGKRLQRRARVLAFAADQLIVGKKLLIKNPGGAPSANNKIVFLSKDPDHRAAGRPDGRSRAARPTARRRTATPRRHSP